MSEGPLSAAGAQAAAGEHDPDPYLRLRQPPPTPSAETCHCPGQPPLLLMWALSPNPVHCLDCNLEVDPSTVPVPVDVVDAVAHWASVDGAIATLELDSGPYESFAQAQLSDLASPVNSEGLAVRAELEKVRRCYLVLFQPLDADLNHAVPQACPGCGGEFREYSSGSFTRLLCEECSLALVNP